MKQSESDENLRTFSEIFLNKPIPRKQSSEDTKQKKAKFKKTIPTGSSQSFQGTSLQYNFDGKRYSRSQTTWVIPDNLKPFLDETPGPAAYTVTRADSLVFKTAPAYTMVGKRHVMGKKSTPGCSQSFQGNGLQYDFDGKRYRRTQKIWDKSDNLKPFLEDTPGPAAYTIKRADAIVSKTSPAYTMVGKRHEIEEQPTPAPNAYKLRTTVGMDNFFYTRSPGYSIGKKSLRNESWIRQKKPDLGMYNLPSLEVYRQRNPAFSFPRAKLHRAMLPSRLEFSQYMRGMQEMKNSWEAGMMQQN